MRTSFGSFAPGRRHWILSLLFPLMVVPGFAQEDAEESQEPRGIPPEKVIELEERQSELQRIIDELRSEIDTLKVDRTGSDSAQDGGVEKPKGRAAQVRRRKAFLDQQIAASLPDGFTLNPEYRGFIPVPNTMILLRFNAKPRVDMTWDNRPGDEDRFVTGRIPVRGSPEYDGRSQFNINSKATFLSFEAVAPKADGNPRFYNEYDFFGSGESEFEFRVRHLYGEAYNFIIGQTFSVFEDPDVWPDTVDFEGPNSMIFARFPVVQYQLSLAEHWRMKFGIEQPDAFASDILVGPVEDVGGFNEYPDVGFNVRWEDSEIGHAQFSSTFRYIGADSPTFGRDQVFGYGVNLSGSLGVFGDDTILGQFTYGEGIGRYGNDTSFFDSDVAFDPSGDLQALEYIGFLAAYTHNWSEKWRSTASYGYVKLANEVTQGPNAYDKTEYVTANVIYQIFEKLGIGAEVIYGTNEVASGARGDQVRLQIGFRYRLF